MQCNGLLDIDVYQRSQIVRATLFRLALDSPAAMRALLCTAALHRTVLGLGSMTDTLSQKCQAITAINQGLSDTSVGLSDSYLYAVSTLVSVEESMVDPRVKADPRQADEEMRQRQIHFEGLKNMIRMRGGLMGLASNRVFQILVSW